VLVELDTSNTSFFHRQSLELLQGVSPEIQEGPGRGQNTWRNLDTRLRPARADLFVA